MRDVSVYQRFAVACLFRSTEALLMPLTRPQLTIPPFCRQEMLRWWTDVHERWSCECPLCLSTNVYLTEFMVNSRLFHDLQFFFTKFHEGISMQMQFSVEFLEFLVDYLRFSAARNGQERWSWDWPLCLIHPPIRECDSCRKKTGRVGG